MTTLAEATLELAKILTDVIEDVATDGSATTLIDTSLGEPDDIYPDDYFTNGVIWLTSGNNDGKMAEITDWVAATHTFTFATLTLLCAADDRYFVAPKEYPLYRLVQAINQATQSFGDIIAVDDATVTVDEQHAYNLPSDIYNVLRVEIASYETGERYYVPNYNWREVGSQIVFDTDQAPDEDDLEIKLTYLAPHTQFNIAQYNGTINSYIHIDRLIWNAAVHALRWRVQRTKEDEPDKLRLLNEALVKAAEMDAKHPIVINLTRRDVHMAGW